MAAGFEYSVAIRTLGQAGEKFRQELDSLCHQTIPPKKIVVYIAEGYPLPKERVGKEQYVYCPKGMVAQRALPFTEIETEWCLFLDDDIFLPPTTVEQLYRAAMRMEGDCIAADAFHNQSMSLYGKVRAFLTNWAFPRRDDEWAFKVCWMGNFSYNKCPSRVAYLSQSAAGACSLWRMDAFRGIHFEHERWMDSLEFAYGDDLLCFYKLHCNGGRLLVHYTSGIVHLDAGTSRSRYKANPRRLQTRSMAWFIIWWRTHYDLNGTGTLRKCLMVLVLMVYWVWQIGLHLFYSLTKLSFAPLWYYLKGNVSGFRFVHSNEYRQIPNFRIEDFVGRNRKEKVPFLQE